MKKTIIGLSLCIALGAMQGCGQQSSEEHIQSAQKYIEQNNQQAAIVELKNAVQKDPRSALARFELGKLYMETNQFESAEKELNRALEYGHPASEVIPFLSQAYQRTGAHAALSEMETENVSLTPTDAVKVGFFKVQALIMLGKLDEARALIEELELLDTQSVYKGLALVYRPLLDNDVETASQQLEALRKQSPLNADLLKLQGQLKLTQKKPQEAAQVYKEYIAEYPDDKQTEFVLAKLLVDSGKLEEAEPHVDALLKIGEKNPLLNQLKGSIRVGLNDFEAGLPYLENAIQYGSKEPIVRLLAGYAAYKLQDYESASRHLSMIASVLPDNHPGLRILAASQLQLGQSSEAGEVLGRLDGMTADDAMLFSRTGYDLMKAGNFKDARELIERSENISKSAEDLTRLGVLKLSLNDLEGIVNLEEALEQQPELEATKATLATAYLATEQWDKAMQLAEQWKQQAPQDVHPYMLAGEVYAKQSQFDKARGEYVKALEIDPKSNLARLAVINVDFMLGEEQTAEADLLELLGEEPGFAMGLASYYVLKRKQGKSDEGMLPALRAFEAKPDDPQVRMVLARMYTSEGTFDKAVELLKPFASVNNPPPAYRPVMGRALLKTGQFDEALALYNDWLADAPLNKEAIMGKLTILDGQRKFAEGLELAESFLEQRDDIQMQLFLTHFQIMQGNFKDGRASFDALPEGVNEYPFVKGMESKLLLAENKTQEALPLASDAYEAIPNTRNLAVLVSALERLNMRAEAVEVLTKHVASQPNDVAAKMLLAERQIGESDESAIATYEASLKMNPDNFVVLNNLAYLYMQEGRLKEAKKHATRAVELQPEHPAALDTLAQILVRDKDYDEALKYYERAIRDDMRNDEIYLNYVETLLAAEQTRLAVRKLEQRTFSDEASLKRIEEFKSKYNLTL